MYRIGCFLLNRFCAYQISNMQLKFYSLESYPTVWLVLAFLFYSPRHCYSDTYTHDRIPPLLTHIGAIDMTKSPISEETRHPDYALHIDPPQHPGL